MKDTVIKGNGTSRTLKAPATMPDNFADWRTQLLAGQATMDIGLNAAGCDEVGTALNKANLLSDATAEALGISSENPTVNEAFEALLDTVPKSEVQVSGDVGSTVTMEKDDVTLSATVGSNGVATLYPSTLGEWTVTWTYEGNTRNRQFLIETITFYFLEPFVVGDTLEDTSWTDIDIISRLGRADEFFELGDTKTFTLDSQTYSVKLIGFDHDDLTGGGKAGITFEMANPVVYTQESRVKMELTATNVNGWSGCHMRQTVLPYYWELLPSEMKNIIKSVNKLTSAGNRSSTIVTTSDKLFLMSMTELYSSGVSGVPAGEGSLYAYYEANPSMDYKRKPFFGSSGNGQDWWTRSPYRSNTSNFFYIGYNGNFSNAEANSYNSRSPETSNKMVSFAFCI